MKSDWWGLLRLLLAALVISQVAACADTPAAAHSAPVQPGRQSRIILRFKTAATPAQDHDVLERLGSACHTHLDYMRSLTADTHVYWLQADATPLADIVACLSAQQTVAFVEPDAPVRAF